MWQSRILFALAHLYPDLSFVLALLAVSQSLCVAVLSEGTLAPVSPCQCGEVAGVKPEHRAWLCALKCPLHLALSTSSVHHLTAVRRVPVSELSRKKQRGGGWGWESHGFSPRGIEFVV